MTANYAITALFFVIILSIFSFIFLHIRNNRKKMREWEHQDRLSHITTIKRFLRRIPEERVIERMSLESRLKYLEEEEDASNPKIS